MAQSFTSRKSLIRMAAVFAEVDEDWAGRRQFNNDSIGSVVEGAEAYATKHDYGGTAAVHAARNVALAVDDNPVAGGKGEIRITIDAKAIHREMAAHHQDSELLYTPITYLQQIN